MEHYTNSLYCFQQLKVEIEKINEAIKSKEFYSLDIYLMEEAEILQFLKISRGTYHKYRKLYKINAISLFGKNFYLKHQILNLFIDQFLK